MLKPLIILFNYVLEVKTKETELPIIITQGEVKLKTGNLLEERKSERPARNLFQFYLIGWDGGGARLPEQLPNEFSWTKAIRIKLAVLN